MKITVIAFSLLTFIVSGCYRVVKEEGHSHDQNVLVQVSVIDALMQGIYDGTFPVCSLLDHGDFGTGTFQALNGEMMILNDTIFQILSSGKVVKPDPGVMTPFAAVTRFKTDTTFMLSDITYDSLKASFAHFFPSPNLFYAVKMKGDFSYMKTRSVPEQVRPYPPFVEVTRRQPEFEFNNVKGDIVGFFSPEYAKGISITGLHLHFLNSDRTGGGHIIEFRLKRGTLEIGYLSDFELLLPEGGDFFKGNFTIDRTKELKEAEN